MTVTWITGASSGIGHALARRLARAGALVVASARNEAALRALAQDRPGRIVAWPLDVTDGAAVAAAVAGIEAAHGPIVRAILNAGTHVPMSAADFSAATLRRLVEVNLMGAAHPLEALLPAMRARGGGHIAVVASVAGYRGLPTAAAYGASKAALINLCEGLKPECDRLGIRLQLVNPGFVDTPLTRRNDFKMPFLISADAAAAALARGLESAAFEIVFPRRFAAIMKLLRVLPYRLYFAAVRRATGA